MWKKGKIESWNLKLSFVLNLMWSLYLILSYLLQDSGVLVWEKPEGRVLIVTKGGHDDVKRFWKRQRANISWPLCVCVCVSHGCLSWVYSWFPETGDVGFRAYVALEEKNSIAFQFPISCNMLGTVLWKDNSPHCTSLGWEVFFLLLTVPWDTILSLCQAFHMCHA